MEVPFKTTKLKITFAFFPQKRICSLYLYSFPHHNSSIFIYLVFLASCSILSYPAHSSTPFCNTHTQTEAYAVLCTESPSCPDPWLLSQYIYWHQLAANQTMLRPQQNLRFRDTNFDFSIVWKWASFTKFLAIYLWDLYSTENKRV